MWLRYGVDDHGALVAVEDAPRGKTVLHCPYCVGKLTAKKGQIKHHHFAHTGQTCRTVRRGNGLSIGKERRLAQRLEARGVLHWNAYQRRGRGGYEITKLGKIPVGGLSLLLFNQVQEPLLHQKHVELEQAVAEARTRPQDMLDQALTDLRLYRAQWRRILSTTLYFLEVHAAGETLYKIGVTQRSVDERVAEIGQEVRAVAGDVTIRVLDTWPQRGNVELYFKHRYAAQQRRLGTLTEYFAFDDVTPVLRDLRRMQPKELTPLEQAILADEPSGVELELAAEANACGGGACI